MPASFSVRDGELASYHRLFPVHCHCSVLAGSSAGCILACALLFLYNFSSFSGLMSDTRTRHGPREDASRRALHKCVKGSKCDCRTLCSRFHCTLLRLLLRKTSTSLLERHHSPATRTNHPSLLERHHSLATPTNTAGALATRTNHPSLLERHHSLATPTNTAGALATRTNHPSLLERHHSPATSTNTAGALATRTNYPSLLERHHSPATSTNTAGALATRTNYPSLLERHHSPATRTNHLSQVSTHHHYQLQVLADNPQSPPKLFQERAVQQPQRKSSLSIILSRMKMTPTISCTRVRRGVGVYTFMATLTCFHGNIRKLNPLYGKIYIRCLAIAKNSL